MKVSRMCLLLASTVASCLYSMEKEETPQKNVSAVKNSLIGAAAGICEVTINQPAVALKNELQTRMNEVPAKSANIKPLTLLAHLYKGYGVNVASMAPITAFQVAANGILHKLLVDSHEPTKIQQICAAFLAGSSSALISSPADMLVIQQGQVTKDTFAQTLKAIFKVPVLSYSNMRKLYRGVITTAIRDGGFTVGYLALADILKNAFNIKTGSSIGDSIATGTVAGLLAGLVTHPFDTISTALKRDLSGNKYKKSLQTGCTLLQEEGLRGLYKGIAPRTGRIALAIPVLSYVKHYLEEKMNK